MRNVPAAGLKDRQNSASSAHQQGRLPTSSNHLNHLTRVALQTIPPLVHPCPIMLFLAGAMVLLRPLDTFQGNQEVMQVALWSDCQPTCAWTWQYR